jgi:hypothetical protein
VRNDTQITMTPQPSRLVGFFISDTLRSEEARLWHTCTDALHYLKVCMYVAFVICGIRENTRDG